MQRSDVSCKQMGGEMWTLELTNQGILLLKLFQPFLLSLSLYDLNSDKRGSVFDFHLQLYRDTLDILKWFLENENTVLITDLFLCISIP